MNLPDNFPQDMKGEMYSFLEGDTYFEFDADRELSEESMNLIVDLVFVGGWVNFVDADGGPIPLRQLPNLRSFRSDAKDIPDGAFYECRSLTSVSLPLVESIGEAAFYKCRSLTSVSLPLVENVGELAFSFCTSLTTVDLPRVKSVGKMAFYGCTSLTSVSLPRVESVGEGAFYGCESLESVSLPSVEEIGYGAFAGCPAVIHVSEETYNKYRDDFNVRPIRESDRPARRRRLNLMNLRL